MPLTEFAAESGAPVTEADVAAPFDTFMVLNINAVVPSLTNPRTTFNEERLAELATSIKASGVHQPILVRPLPAHRVVDTSRARGGTGPSHEIVSGERRYRASRLAGVATIPALIRSLTDAQVLEIQIVENLQRDDLTELEEAEGYQRLCDETSIAKEEIGSKIGRSRSYVYQRLKLLDLNTAARESLRNGEIDASKALLIARIPDDKLQIKALHQANGEGNYGHALSVKDLQAWLQTNVMLPLKRARFDIRDVTLRPQAGACPDCPKRTGANPDLFADVESADICTDPGCYHDKEKTSDDRRFEQAQREGKKVIDAAKAEKLLEPHSRQWLKGYQLLDEYPDYNLGVDGGTLRKALGKHCPAPVLAMNPTTGVLAEVLPTDQVKKTIREHHLSRDAKREQKDLAKKAAEPKKPIEQRREFHERWQLTAITKADAHVKTMEPVIPAELLRAWLLDRLDSYDSNSFGAALDLGTEFDEAEARRRVLAMPPEELPRLFMRFVLHESEYQYDAWADDKKKQQAPRSALFELLHMAGVQLGEVQADAKRAIESEDRAAAMEAEPKNAAPATELAALQGKVGKGKKSTKPAAPAKVPKTTPEEASKSIAAALQELDAEPVRGAVALGVGVQVKVLAEARSLPQKNYVGKTGTVKSQIGSTAWNVTVDKPGRWPRVCAFDSSELEVVS